MAGSKRDIPSRAECSEDAGDDCVKRESLMSMIGALSDDTTRIEDRLGELGGVLAPLVEGGIAFSRDDDGDCDERCALPAALSQIDRLRDRLARIERFIGEMACRTQV